MSQENVEIVRRGFDAWNAGRMDALRDLYAPDVIVRAVGAGRSQGHTSEGRP